jgi:hypothetical protein
MERKEIKGEAGALMGAGLELERLEEELGRAYRCIRGFYSFVQRDVSPDRSFLAYQSPTIGAAIRFVSEGALDGAAYFEGKPIDVLQAALKQ